MIAPFVRQSATYKSRHYELTNLTPPKPQREMRQLFFSAFDQVGPLGFLVPVYSRMPPGLRSIFTPAISLLIGSSRVIVSIVNGKNAPPNKSIQTSRFTKALFAIPYHYRRRRLSPRLGKQLLAGHFQPHRINRLPGKEIPGPGRSSRRD